MILSGVRSDRVSSRRQKTLARWQPTPTRFQRVICLGGKMKFCTDCGTRVMLETPPGDDRKRFVCRSCGLIHYQNPKLVVGCIPEMEGRVLLCRRAIEPRYGKWTLPAGYLENGETVTMGAKREAFEEARATFADLEPYLLFNIRHINQIYLMFRGQLANGRYGSGHESLEVRLFEEAEIPWDDLAFGVIRATLSRYFQDRPTGIFDFHIGDIALDDAAST
jgi:ADP-ribose pyrophosphatase YjhB (NUDIX family)